jgi:hypothetical protein
MTWLDETIEVLRELGGIASLRDIYELVLKRGNKQSSIKSSDWKATIRQGIYDNSLDSISCRREKAIFYSAEGLGKGIWGLCESYEPTFIATDISEPILSQCVQQEVYRVLRDTVLSRSIKSLHKNTCQICGKFIEMLDGKRYSETHHIQPLGNPHNGPDVAGNIMVLCPNHHVEFDYGLIAINPKNLQLIYANSCKSCDYEFRTNTYHNIERRYLKYHLEKIFKGNSINV